MRATIEKHLARANARINYAAAAILDVLRENGPTHAGLLQRATGIEEGLFTVVVASLVEAHAIVRLGGGVIAFLHPLN